jgi:glucan phosphoethanolaminetransferase (alkaline phosphatase superfamily)
LRRLVAAGGGLLPIPLLLLGADLFVRREWMAGWDATWWAAYALSLALALAAWWLAFVVAWWLYERAPRVTLALATAASAFVGFAVVASFTYLSEFHAYPGPSTLVFLIEERENIPGTAGLLSVYFTPLVLSAMALCLLAAAGALWGLLRWARRLRPQGVSRRRLLAAAVAFALLLGARASVPGRVAAVTPDGNVPLTFALASTYYARRSKGRFHASERVPVPAVTPDKPTPNVLLIVQESLGRYRMHSHGYGKPNTPELEARAAREPDNFLVFEQAITNSGNTSVTLPSLLTGLAPGASAAELHSSPFVWHYASAAGYTTFMLSAQSFAYANFEDFFLTSPPDHAWTAEPDEVELVNGGGMDDELFQARVLEAIDAAAATGKPFFGVAQYNATHHPILKRPPFHPALAGESRPERYDNAVFLLDLLFERLLQHLERKGLLEDTLVVMTSDHGENLSGLGTHRTQAYYEAVLGIPLVIRVPRTLAEAKPAALAGLKANRGRRVQNLDIVPTIFDLMGLWSAPSLAELMDRVGGASLLEPQPADRILIALNNTETRQWTNEGFAIIRGHEKYIFTEWRGEQFHDLRGDPMERRNLWKERRDQVPWVAETIRANPALEIIHRRHLRRN